MGIVIGQCLRNVLMVITLVIRITESHASKQCPSGCICISQKNAIPTSYCDGLELRTVPKNIAKDTEILMLSSNNFNQITDKDFASLANLTRLSLKMNGIQKISDDAFLHLSKLKSLNLGKNHLTSISVKVFQNIPQLEELYLNNNSLTTLPKELFKVLPKLRRLYLSSNWFDEKTSVFLANLRNLEYLDLSKNRLQTIDGRMFRNSQNLKTLKLDENKIKFIDTDSFDTLRDLQELRLDNNALYTLDENVFENNEQLTGVTLHNNPLQCNCDLKWIHDAIKNGWPVFKDKEKIRCHSPYKLEGRQVTTLSIGHFGCIDVWGSWGTWSKCYRPCHNGGMRYRARKCVATDTKYCSGPTKMIERNCGNSTMCLFKSSVVTEWSAWTLCPVDCQPGNRTRKRGALIETQPCDRNNHCPGQIDGAWSKWSVWSKCDQKCRSKRKRTCSNPRPQHGGALCKEEGGSMETQEKICLGGLCAPKTGKGSWGDWSNWGSCEPVTCKKSRTRQCKHFQSQRCNGEKLEERVCAKEQCFIQSVWAKWGKWTECSKSCNGGRRLRTRHCPGEGRLPGITCGKLKNEMQTCNIHSCESYSWGDWGQWSVCPKNLTGKQVRKRECVGSGKHKLCTGKAKERRECKVLLLLTNNQGKTLQGGKAGKCQPRGAFPNGVEVIKQTKDGIMAQYTCNKHYKLKGGPATMTCIHDRGWTSTNIPYCAPSCGKPVFKSRSHWLSRARLFGGEVTVPHSWPWQVAIEVKTKDEGWKLRCGGSLINEQWIVTAGHCMFDKNARLFRPSEVKIYLGVHNITLRAKSKQVQMRFARFVTAYPKFDHESLDNDIGMILLKRPIKINEKVLPVCLPSSRQKHLASVGATGTVVGWGVTRTRSASDVLKELRLPVIAHRQCVNAYLGKSYSVTESMFCAVKSTNEDTCKGDSGGGYLFRDPRKKRWTLQGIVSWGGFECGQPNQPSVYTKVTMFTSWIRKIMRERDLFEKRKRNKE